MRRSGIPSRAERIRDGRYIVAVEHLGSVDSLYDKRKNV